MSVDPALPKDPPDWALVLASEIESSGDPGIATRHRAARCATCFRSARSLEAAFVDRAEALLFELELVRRRSRGNADDVERSLRWYSERAGALRRYLAEGNDVALEAVVTELRLDGGSRARNALRDPSA